MTLLTDKIFTDIPTDHPVIVAVSGGSDSLGLLLLANAWAKQSGAILQAVTVDHGLRPEAAAEAAFVSGVCHGLDIAHVTLAWAGAKPSFGIQDAARQSRYALMSDYGEEIGADIILTGHTQDDQAETVLMRLLRESPSNEGRGLSGMSRVTWLYDRVRIVRPLLETSRSQLRKLLGTFSQGWVEDPTNLDESYERVRIRRSLEGSECLQNQLIDFSRVCGRFRAALSRSVARFLASQVKVLPGPVFELNLKTAGLEDPKANPVAMQAVQVLIAISGGGSRLLARHRMEGVADLIAHACSGKKKIERINVGGAIVETAANRLLFYRETRNLASVYLDPGESTIWDGRLLVCNETASAVFVKPASLSDIKLQEKTRGEKFRVHSRRVLTSTPVIHLQSEAAEGASASPIWPMIEASPTGRGLEIRLAAPVIEQYSPEFDTPIVKWFRSLDRYIAASLQP